MNAIENISNFENKTVVITGASSGVGLATAEAFAKAGCNLVLVARGAEALDIAVKRCEVLGAKAIAVPTDVSDYVQVQQLISHALAFRGKIDYWINNAGVMASGKFEEIPIEVSHQVVKTNLFGYLNCAHALLPVFKQQGHGVLVNNVSIGGYMPAPYSAVYSATKFGIKGMMECLQGELSAEEHIHICNLYPQIQRSTGNMHSAKYSGLDFKVPPFAADPKDTAAQLLQLAIDPQKDKFPDFSSWALKTMHSIFPKLLVNTASAGMRMMMKLKQGQPTAGNVLQPSGNPHRIYGETIWPVPSKTTKMAMGIGVLVGVVLLMTSSRRG
ncbi:SDR family NAD(P)-dependent oxidoreductase [Pedobacter xixiisoli]|uniref:Short-chain dehydrogenase n=1 Tax=Pedobacter xixiisoli TaxID=1476464 RepID=A0A285ZP67_9SPHI|nr:SDR family NAD(P)-dependent oxidoreductase [Pedobacter xixiisoli]SOD11445.1 Short-chain dehydrogenase [Pedobacter xixiisoli]